MTIVQVELQKLTQFICNSILATSCIHKIEKDLARIERTNEVVKKCWLINNTSLTQSLSGASHISVNSH